MRDMKRSEKILSVLFGACVVAAVFTTAKSFMRDERAAPPTPKVTTGTETTAQATPSRPATSTPSAVRPAVTQCRDRQGFQAWQAQCVVAFSFVTLPTTADGEHPAKLTLLHDGSRVIVAALVPDWYHKRFYTDRARVLAFVDDVPHVENRAFLNQKFPPSITIGNDVFSDFSWRGDAQWVASLDASNGLSEAMKAGADAKVQITRAWDGPIQATISLRGFTAALEHLEKTGQTQPPSPANWPTTAVEAIGRVAATLTPNRFQVTPQDLAATANPHGKGFFVYVPQTRFEGAERLFLWFVGNGAVMKLNGATHDLSPSLPWARDVDPALIEGAGIPAEDILGAGLSLRQQ